MIAQPKGIELMMAVLLVLTLPNIVTLYQAQILQGGLRFGDKTSCTQVTPNRDGTNSITCTALTISIISDNYMIAPIASLAIEALVLLVCILNICKNTAIVTPLNQIATSPTATSPTAIYPLSHLDI